MSSCLLNFKNMPKPKNKNSATLTKVKQVLKTLRALLQRDGGDLEFKDFDPATGVVKISLKGACAHCPMAFLTLKQGIEESLKKEVPEVKKVEAVE